MSEADTRGDGESARQEALRLAREAGFVTASGVWSDIAVTQLIRLIALARQRPGWVWVPEEPTTRMLQEIWERGDGDLYFVRRKACYTNMLVAAPKPEDKP